MFSYETVNLRATLQVLGDDVHILESFMDVLIFENTIRTAEFIRLVSDLFRLTNYMSCSKP